MGRLIDADALMKDIDSEMFSTESRKCYEKSRVRKQPTIDAEPVRHGRWIEPYPNDIWDCYQCTCCKSTFGNTMNYCPNCGAKMMEVQNNKEE